MLFMFYCFFLLPGALAILSLNQNLFFKTSIVILLVSYTTFMSYHFQVLLAALSQQVQGTLWTSLKLTVYHDPWSYLLLPLRTCWVFRISKLCILGTGTPWNLCIILNQIFCNVVNTGVRNWNLDIISCTTGTFNMHTWERDHEFIPRFAIICLDVCTILLHGHCCLFYASIVPC